MAPSPPRRCLLAVGAVVALLLAGCSDADQPGTGPAPSAGTATDDRPDRPDRGERRSRRERTPAPTAPARTSAPPAEPFGGRRVVAVSIDGLNPDALVTLGAAGAPAIWALLDRGAATLNARTEQEKTVTLPNHVGMVTGRPVSPGSGGHGVTWNSDLPGRTVQEAAGSDIGSVFTVVHGAGGSTAVFAGKSKFGLFEASWPESVDETVIVPGPARLTAAVTADLRGAARTFTFVHVAEPDAVGHRLGWLTPAYLDAVRRADDVVGAIVDAVADTPALADDTVVVLTADHGGSGPGHGDPADPADYTVPFAVAGPGVTPGDLYALSPGLRDPGTGRPGYDGPQPARNCDLANVSLRALGLDPVPGSRCVGSVAMPVAPPG